MFRALGVQGCVGFGVYGSKGSGFRVSGFRGLGVQGFRVLGFRLSGFRGFRFGGGGVRMSRHVLGLKVCC